MVYFDERILKLAAAIIQKSHMTEVACKRLSKKLIIIIETVKLKKPMAKAEYRLFLFFQ